MIQRLAKTCRPVKKESILNQSMEYRFLDAWTEQYDREMTSQYKVSTHISHYTLNRLQKSMEEYLRYEDYKTCKSPMERYTKDNRLKITPTSKKTLFASQNQERVRPPRLAVNTRVSASVVSSDDIEHKRNKYSAKFQTILTQLKRKTEQLIHQAHSDHVFYAKRYEKVGLAAQALVTALEDAQQKFFSTNDGKTSSLSPAAFTKACHTAINEAEGEFKNHRHVWGQLDSCLKAILGILALITILPALIVSSQSRHGYYGTFFAQQPTDSSVQLKRFESAFEYQIEMGILSI